MYITVSLFAPGFIACVALFILFIFFEQLFILFLVEVFFGQKQ
jgi:hypothetical protein